MSLPQIGPNHRSILRERSLSSMLQFMARRPTNRCAPPQHAPGSSTQTRPRRHRGRSALVYLVARTAAIRPTRSHPILTRFQRSHAPTNRAESASSRAIRPSFEGRVPRARLVGMKKKAMRLMCAMPHTEAKSNQARPRVGRKKAPNKPINDAARRAGSKRRKCATTLSAVGVPAHSRTDCGGFALQEGTRTAVSNRWLPRNVAKRTTSAQSAPLTMMLISLTPSARTLRARGPISGLSRLSANARADGGTISAIRTLP